MVEPQVVLDDTGVPTLASYRAEAEGGEPFLVEVAALAEAAGINGVYLSQIQRDRRTGSVKALPALADCWIAWGIMEGNDTPRRTLNLPIGSMCDFQFHRILPIPSAPGAS